MRDWRDWSDRPISTGDVIQIDPAYDQVNPKKFGGCFAIVDQVKSFGCQCYIRIPGPDGGDAYLRLDSKHFELIGHAAWRKPDDADHPDNP